LNIDKEKETLYLPVPLTYLFPALAVSAIPFTYPFSPTCGSHFLLATLTEACITLAMLWALWEVFVLMAPLTQPSSFSSPAPANHPHLLQLPLRLPLQLSQPLFLPCSLFNKAAGPPWTRDVLSLQSA